MIESDTTLYFIRLYYNFSYRFRSNCRAVFRLIFEEVECKIDNVLNLRDLLLQELVDPLNSELNPICYLLALLAHHFLHVSRIRVKPLTIRLLMSYIYIYGAPILDVSRSHTTTQHSR